MAKITKTEEANGAVFVEIRHDTVDWQIVTRTDGGLDIRIDGFELLAVEPVSTNVIRVRRVRRVTS
jgi:hypothetical protein